MDRILCIADVYIFGKFIGHAAQCSPSIAFAFGMLHKNGTRERRKDPAQPNVKSYSSLSSTKTEFGQTHTIHTTHQHKRDTSVCYAEMAHTKDMKTERLEMKGTARPKKCPPFFHLW